MWSVKWTVSFLLLPSCWAQFLCPDVAALGSSLLLTCVRSGPDDIFINTPYGATLTCNPRCSTQDIRLDDTTVNTTHVILEVSNVQEEDGGTWKCGPRYDQTSCKLTVFQVPSCNISSETDTDKLHIGEELRLSVTIEDHFCSDLIDFQLQTGSVTEKVVDDLRVAVANSTGVFNSTFSISHSHIGFVELLFTCNTARERIPCGGVKSLIVIPAGHRMDNTVAIATGSVTPPAIVIAVSFIAVYIRRRRQFSKTSTMGNDSTPYADVADSVHARPKSRPDNEAYAEIAEINESFSNTTSQKESAGSKRDIQMFPNVAYISIEDIGKDGQSYTSQLSDSKPITETPEPLYTEVNKKTSPNDDC